MYESSQIIGMNLCFTGAKDSHLLTLLILWNALLVMVISRTLDFPALYTAKKERHVAVLVILQAKHERFYN